MKIILFVHSLDRLAGGTASYIKLLADKMRLHYDLEIVTSISKNQLTINDVNIHSFDFNIFKLRNLKKSFKSLLIQTNPDIVHINGIWTPQNSIFQKVAKELGLKVIISPHGMLEPYIMDRNRFKKKIALKLYQDEAIRQADYLHATAKSEKEHIEQLGYNNKTIIIPNGIELTDLSIKETWNSNEKFEMLFLSRIHPKKGIDFLIKAVSLLNNDKIHVTIAGEGDERYISDLKKLIKENSVESQFSFVGGVYGDKKRELFLNSDIFVLPTHSENFGIVVAEALSSGLPVITTKGTPWEDLKLHNCGWWIQLNIESLKEAILSAYNASSSELRTMGLNGIKLIKDKYDINLVVSQTQEFYKFVINN